MACTQVQEKEVVPVSGMERILGGSLGNAANRRWEHLGHGDSYDVIWIKALLLP